jgi:N-acetylglutamate synthase-like GNAT family acetyltransferase
MSVAPAAIRRAAAADERAAVSILQEYYEAARVVVRDDTLAIREYLTGPGALWLSELDRAPIGCIALRPLPLLAKDVCEVKRLYVRDAYRGRGIADRLHDALESHARAAGIPWMYLDTTHGMQAAVKFYSRHGYEPCERYNDNPQATLFMRKTLATPADPNR